MLRVGCTLNSFWSPILARFFSAGHVKSNLSENAPATKQREQDEAAKRAKQLARNRRKVDVRRQKLASDAESLREYRKKQRARKHSPMQQAYYEEVSKQKAQRRKTDHVYALRLAVPEWVRHNQWARESVPWKTHVPVVYDEKVSHECEKCFVTRHGGLKLWWQKKNASGQDHQSYECHNCYFTGPEQLPEGYEDIPEATFTAFKARKIELDGPDSIPKSGRRSRKIATTKKP